MDATESPCPDENQLSRFARGGLETGEVARLESHLDGCGTCRRVVAAVAAEASVHGMELSGERDASAGEEALAPRATLGRYEVRERLGAGGMGVVYAALDPRLGRRVALKLLHPRLARAEEARARLVREAQALARLSHPNVVSLFELGVEGERVFLALELVEGPTLAEWLQQARRPWPEVLAMFLRAGAGLAAAHAAGLVHRDFKPGNVLVGPDGRPRVTDFGLVRGAVGDEPSEAVEPRDAPKDGLMTRAGALLGTPAYMSPEQRAGRLADARSDQYSFCLALREALTGEASSRGRVPRRLEGVLRRGLSEDPAARYPSMETLLEALGSPPRVRARHWAAAGVVGLAALALALGWWSKPATKSSATARDPLTLKQGETRELHVPGLRRIAVDDPNVVDVREAGKDGLGLYGLAPGRTTLITWDGDGRMGVYEVAVGE